VVELADSDGAGGMVVVVNLVPFLVSKMLCFTASCLLTPARRPIEGPTEGLRYLT